MQGNCEAEERFGREIQQNSKYENGGYVCVAIFEAGEKGLVTKKWR